MIKTSRRLWLAAALLTVAAVAGCAAPTPSAGPTPSAPPTTAPATGSALPPRPATLQLDTVKACDLLTAGQIKQLGLLDGVPTTDDVGPACIWADAANSVAAWIAGPVLSHGAAYFLNSTTGATLTTVDGYAAVATSSDFAHPEAQCLLYVDTAPNQSLEVDYDAGTAIGHDKACQQASRVASLMLANRAGQ